MKKINFNFKKNQIVIYTVALMLVVMGYLNYTGGQNNEKIAQVSSNAVVDENTTNENNDVIGNSITETAAEIENTTKNEANIGDAQLVSSSDVKKTEDTDYFTSSRLERDNMYSQILESYEKILNSTNATETQKQSVTEEITKINNTKNSIMICENLMKTKGFESSVIFVNGDSVNVIVKADELQQDQIAQIQNIVSRELKVEVQNIHIANK